MDKIMKKLQKQEHSIWILHKKFCNFLSLFAIFKKSYIPVANWNGDRNLPPVYRVPVAISNSDRNLSPFEMATGTYFCNFLRW